MPEMARGPEEFDGADASSHASRSPQLHRPTRLEVLGITDRLDDFNTLLRLRTAPRKEKP
jgi:hypothetical protein